jgi:hypothetical protein
MLHGLQVPAWTHGVRRWHSVAGNIDSDAVISEHGKNPSTLDLAQGAGRHWIGGYGDLAGR